LGLGSGIASAAALGGASEREDKAIDTIYEAFKEKGNSVFDEEEFKKILDDNGITDADEKLAESLIEQRKEIKNLIYSLNENSK
jgi:gas vesicle protein